MAEPSTTSGTTPLLGAASPTLVTRKSFRATVQRAVSTTIIVVGAAFVLIPFVWMVSTSIKSTGEVFLIPVRWIPHQVELPELCGCDVGDLVLALRDQQHVHHRDGRYRIGHLLVAGGFCFRRPGRGGAMHFSSSS